MLMYGPPNGQKKHHLFYGSELQTKGSGRRGTNLGQIVKTGSLIVVLATLGTRLTRFFIRFARI